jgi:WD40 repeat protein
MTSITSRCSRRLVTAALLAIAVPAAVGGHSGSVARLLYAFNGEVLVSANEFGVLHFLTPDRGEPVRTVSPEWVGAPMAMRAGKDGTLVLAGLTAGETAAAWTVSRSGAVTKLLDVPLKDVKALALSHDASLLAAGTWDGRAVVLDVRSGRAVGSASGGGSPVDALAISPDDRTLATARGPAVELRAVSDGAPPASLHRAGHGVGGLYFTPGGRLLVEAGGEVGMWPATLDRRLGVARKGTATGAFDPGGTLTAVADGTRVLVWDLARDAIVATIPATEVGAVAFSPDGRRLVIGLLSGRVILKEIGGRR